VRTTLPFGGPVSGRCPWRAGWLAWAALVGVSCAGRDACGAIETSRLLTRMDAQRLLLLIVSRRHDYR
jgi:hypothetical protein